MYKDSFHRNMTGNAKWGVIMVVLALVITASLFLWKGKQDAPSSIDSTVTASDPDSANPETNAKPFTMPQKKVKPDVALENQVTEESPSNIEEIKAKQEVAAKAAIDARPIDGTVSHRPEFVSEIEWDVLKGAVAENDDVDMALSHFVNKLLFFKKRDAWMDSSTPAETRKKLARELLEMIPVQISEMAIDQAFADKMTADLNTFLNSSVN